jgi:hypothetical protein
MFFGLCTIPALPRHSFHGADPWEDSGKGKKFVYFRGTFYFKPQLEGKDEKN